MTIDEIKKVVDGFAVKNGYAKCVPLLSPNSDVPYSPITSEMVDEAYTELYAEIIAGKYDEYPSSLISVVVHYWD